MNAFFYYFYNYMRSIVDLLWGIVIAIKDAVLGILDVQFYMNLFSTYKSEMSPMGWVAAIIMHILIYILIALIIFLLVKGIKVLLRFKVPVIEYERMKDEIVTLKREIMKANYEKDKILAMKISEMGMEVNKELLDSELKEPEDTDAEVLDTEDVVTENAEFKEDEKVETVVVGEPRFPRLSSVDSYYLADTYVKPEYNTKITLEEVCINFRNFAASRLHLYYDLEVIKQMFATFGAAKMLILQGISGTGKTSLPYAFGQFIMNPSLICSVQPSWRDRTELFGYYNDFTKKYTETEFLKTLYKEPEPAPIVVVEYPINYSPLIQN